MQRARHEAPPQQELRRAGAGVPAEPRASLASLRGPATGAAHRAEQDYHEPQQYADEQPADPSRYDDALYGQLESGQQEYARDPAYPDDPYAYQSGYEEEPEHAQKRRSGLMTVVAVLALAVVGTGAAFAYRTYVGSPRSGEPPIIKADNSPTKVVPAPADGVGQDAGPHGGRRRRREDRSREETPVDVNAKVRSARGVSAAEPERQSAAGRQRFAERAAAGDAPQRHPAEQRAAQDQDPGGQGRSPTTAASRAAPRAAAKPAPAARTTLRRQPPAARNPSSANASANAPLSLSPQAAPRPTGRRPGWPPPIRCRPRRAAASGGGYLVQVSSQKNEADAQASFRALQGKFPRCWDPVRR